MELQKFVSESLSQIAKGVSDAQNNPGIGLTKINPKADTRVHSENRMWDVSGVPIQDVEFDVAITNTDNTKTEGGIGVFLGSVGLGAKGSSGAENSSFTRIKFRVPIALPVPHNG